jgi:hypothetical protein
MMVWISRELIGVAPVCKQDDCGSKVRQKISIGGISKLLQRFGASCPTFQPKTS